MSSGEYLLLFGEGRGGGTSVFFLTKMPIPFKLQQIIGLKREE